MSIEVEYFGLTGRVGGYPNDLLPLKHSPSTGADSAYDVAVDPTDGPAQRIDIDFGVTFMNVAGTTAAIALNLPNSNIKDVLNDTSHGVTGILYLRAVYNYV